MNEQEVVEFVAFPWGLETMWDSVGMPCWEEFVAFPWGLETNFLHNWL